MDETQLDDSPGGSLMNGFESPTKRPKMKNANEGEEEQKPDITLAAQEQDEPKLQSLQQEDGQTQQVPSQDNILLQYDDSSAGRLIDGSESSHNQQEMESANVKEEEQKPDVSLPVQEQVSQPNNTVEPRPHSLYQEDGQFEQLPLQDVILLEIDDIASTDSDSLTEGEGDLLRIFQSFFNDGSCGSPAQEFINIRVSCLPPVLDGDQVEISEDYDIDSEGGEM